MYPSTLLMIVVAAGAAVVHGGHPAANTPAAQFWEQALPGTPMPEFIADLVRRGSDHSPFGKRYTALPGTANLCIIYDTKLPSAEARKCLFFHEELLRPGSTMTFAFPAEAVPAILPYDVAEKAPFANLYDVLAAFDIPAGSAEAAQVEHTLSLCRAPPIAGEVKACATSLESAVQSAARMLGGASGYAAGVRAATSEVPAAGLPRQPYVVQAVTPLDGDHHVACHVLPFPYAVYQCHMASVMSEKVSVVSLRGLSDGTAADMVAFCHLDTSNWNPAHPAFEVLHSRPGGAPVCHFMPYGNLAFVKTATTA